MRAMNDSPRDVAYGSAHTDQYDKIQVLDIHWSDYNLLRVTKSKSPTSTSWLAVARLLSVDKFSKLRLNV